MPVCDAGNGTRVVAWRGHVKQAAQREVGAGAFYALLSFACSASSQVVAYGFTNSTPGSPGALNIATALGIFASLHLRHFLWSWFDGKDAVFYGSSSVGSARDAYATDFAALVALVQSGALKPNNDGGREWPLAEAPAALAAVAAGTHRGKQIIVCD